MDALEDWLPRLPEVEAEAFFLLPGDILPKLGAFLAFDDSSSASSSSDSQIPETALKQRQKNAADLSLRAYRSRRKWLREAGVDEDETDAR